MIKKVSLLTISNFVTRALSLVFFVILARIYTVQDYGQFRYLITIASLFFVLLNCYPTTFTKFTSSNKKNKNKFFSNVVFISLLIYIVSGILITTLIQNSLLVLILLLGLFYDAVYFALIRADLNLKKIALFKSGANLFKIILLLIIFYMLKEISLITAILIFSFSSVFPIILLEIKNRTKIKFSTKLISIKALIKLSKYALPILLGSASFDLLFNIDTLFVKHLLSNLEVGYYSVAKSITQIFTFMPLAIGTMLMPHVSKIKNKKESIKNLKKLLKLTFITSTIIFILLLILTKTIINLVFTEKYLPSLNTVYILSIGQVFFMAYILYEAVWQGFNKPKIPSLIILFVCVINIIGNFLLIPFYGINGAALSTTFASFLAFLLSSIIFYKNEIKQTNSN